MVLQYKRLKTVRRRNNETQEELARAIGVSVSKIQKAEQGRQGLSDPLKVKIAEHYHQTVGYIFFDDPITNSNNPVKASGS